MSGDGAVPALEYGYRPSLIGAPYEFRASEYGLDWNTGGKSGRIAWRDVRHVRMSYRPTSMQPHRFVTEIWAEGAPTLTLMSTSWKSMVVRERLDASYTAFIVELHRQLARTQSRALFEQGTNPLRYWPGLTVYVAVSLMLAALVARGLQAHALGGTLFVAAFLALFLWRGGDYFRRNRPRFYRADKVPEELLPKGSIAAIS